MKCQLSINKINGARLRCTGIDVEADPFTIEVEQEYQGSSPFILTMKICDSSCNYLMLSIEDLKQFNYHLERLITNARIDN